jgi:hypothetical protein
MDFKASGLPQNKLVEEAFNYSRANAQGNAKEAMKSFQQQIEIIHTQQIMMLDMDRDQNSMSDAEYNKAKKDLEKLRDEQMKMGPALITRELENMFEQRRVGPAKTVAAHADAASPEVLAAILLIDCVRSPVDYKNVVAKFGEPVANLIAEVVHIDAYPSERDANLAKAQPDTKRAYESLLITSLEGIVAQIARSAKDSPGQKIMFPPGQEEQIYSDVKNLWGNDKKLDKKFMDAFNKAASAAASPYTLEVDNKGDLELVKGMVKKPGGPKPPKPKGPGDGGIGGDVF